MPQLNKSSLWRDLLLITLGWLLTSLIFLGYIKVSRGSIENVYKAWDGPSYVIAGLSEYVPSRAVELNTIRSVAITPDFTFLPAHFPLYPTLIRLFSFLGPFQSMLGLTLLGNLGFLYGLYFLARALKFRAPLLPTLAVLLFPPRYFIVSHTGSSEPLFLMFMTFSLGFFVKKQALSSALFSCLALLTRPQGALLGLGYGLVAVYELLQTRNLKAVLTRFTPYLLLPLTLILIFLYYQHQTGDFWAFYSSISIFHHFAPTLFPTFHYGAPNVETFWHEINVFYYFIYLYALIRLWKDGHAHFALLGLVFYLPLLTLQHTDISRYSLSLLPFAWVAYYRFLSRRGVLLSLLLLLPAVILYSADFIQHNRAP